MRRAVILTNFGDCDEAVNEMIAQVGKMGCSCWPVYVFADHRFETKAKEVFVVTPLWKDHARCTHRNSNLWRFKGMLQLNYDAFLYLDLDMKIVNRMFSQGFRLAEKFGLCLPINPRSFVGLDSEYGEDPEAIREYPLATAYNTSPTFACLAHSPKVRWFIEEYVREYKAKPGRAGSVIWRTMKKTGFIPYALAQEWCLCENRTYRFRDAQIPPVIIHHSSDEMKELYEEICSTQTR